jgi:chromate transporter
LNHKPSTKELFLSFLRLGLTAFGGPAMIVSIKETMVHRHKWIEEKIFQDGVALCQSIPGSTAMQMAAYVGLRTGGLPGALLSYMGFGLPAFVLMFALSELYAETHTISEVVSAFNGLQVIVVAIVAHAAYSFGRTMLKGYGDMAMAVVSAALFWLGISPFVVIIGAALSGIVFFKNVRSVSSSDRPEETGRRIFRQIALLFFVLLTGFIGLYGINTKLFELAALMLKIDFFAYGGGFAALPLMLHEVVGIRGWMDAKTFMDGIALGQLTPGPIAITSTFVGYVVHGASGAVVSTIATFAPSFIILVVATPFFDRLKNSAYFLRATRGILASFVGLLFFVTIKFASAVPWDIIRTLLVFTALAGLLKKVDILYIVLAGAVISVLIF